MSQGPIWPWLSRYGYKPTFVGRKGTDAEGQSHAVAWIEEEQGEGVMVTTWCADGFGWHGPAKAFAQTFEARDHP